MQFSDLLTKEQKEEILKEKLMQFYVEGYQLSLNLQVAKDTNNGTALNESHSAIKTLEVAVAVYTKELESLNN
jgi:excinuclease UvrABC nuclease subunit